MKKLVTVLVMSFALITACNADSGSNATQTDRAPVANTAPADTLAENAGSGTQVTEKAMQALKAMSPESGIENFDAAAVASAGDAKFTAGKDYQILSPSQPTSSDPGVVEVAEVFMHTCPHCFNLEPFIERYMQRKPIGVNFIRIPAQFNAPAKVHAKAYYTAEALGVSEQVHVPIFKALHVDRKRLSNEADIKKLFLENGVSAADFDSTFNSFAVDAKLRKAMDLSVRYNIQSVPTLVINGKYVTSGTMAQTIDRLNEILDYLVAKELSER